MKNKQTVEKKQLTYTDHNGKTVTNWVAKVGEKGFAVYLDGDTGSQVLIMDCPYIGGNEDFPIIKKAWESKL